MANATLITGADGYLGRRIARILLKEEDARLILWMRAADASAFENKRARLAGQMLHDQGRVEYHWGDLAADAPFDDIDPKSIIRIIHTAAVTRFNVDQDTARRVNVEGTDKLLRYARRCDSLERLGFLST